MQDFQPPDIVAIAFEAIERSGVDPEEVDEVDCLVKLGHLIIGTGAHYLRVLDLDAAATGLEALRRRADFSEGVLWDYFAGLGAPGVVARHRVVKHFDAGEFTAVLVSLIRNGECRHRPKLAG